MTNKAEIKFIKNCHKNQSTFVTSIIRCFGELNWFSQTYEKFVENEIDYFWDTLFFYNNSPKKAIFV